MYGDYIAYDCWLGKVYDLKNQVILKLSNGARYFSPSCPLWLSQSWSVLWEQETVSASFT